MRQAHIFDEAGDKKADLDNNYANIALLNYFFACYHKLRDNRLLNFLRVVVSRDKGSACCDKIIEIDVRRAKGDRNRLIVYKVLYEEETVLSVGAESRASDRLVSAEKRQGESFGISPDRFERIELSTDYISEKIQSGR